MLKLLSIAAGTFQELIRQPVYLLLLAGGTAFIALLGNLSYFAFGDESRMVKQSALAFMLVAGLFSAALSASSTLAREIRTGTALAVLSKPVGRVRFLLGKYLGLAAALALQAVVHLLAVLLAGRMAYDAYGGPDWLGLATLATALLVAVGAGAASNFFAHRPFASDAVIATSVAVLSAFMLINCFNRAGSWEPFAQGIDWRLVPAGVLILFALLVIGGIAIASSTRLEMVPTLAICGGVFLIGLLSDYMFGRAAANGSAVADALHGIVPNWQVFWMADALVEKKTIPWSYVAKTAGYVAGQLVVALSIGLALFEDRELN